MTDILKMPEEPTAEQLGAWAASLGDDLPYEFSLDSIRKLYKRKRAEAAAREVKR